MQDFIQLGQDLGQEATAHACMNVKDCMQDPVGFCWILVKIKDRTHQNNTWNL